MKINPPSNAASAVFPKPIFWDVNIENLDWKNDSAFIIERVLDRNLGRVHLLDYLDKVYPKAMIRRVARQSRAIRGNENIEFLADRYGLIPADFKNYIKQ